MTEHYKKLKDKHFKKYQEVKKQNSLLGWLRLLVILALLFCVYKIFNSSAALYGCLSFALLLLFLFLLKAHEKIFWEKTVLEKLLEINEDEIEYLPNSVMQGTCHL